MLTPSPMELINIVILKEKEEEVMSGLLRLGIFHPVDIRRIEDQLENLSPPQVEKEYAELGALEVKLTDIGRKLNLTPHPRKDAEALSYEKIRDFFAKLDEALPPLLSRKDESLAEMKAKEALLSQIEAYFPFSMRRGALYTFLEVSVGKVEEKNIEVAERGLHDIPHVIYPFRKEGDRVVALVIGLRRDRALLDKILKDVSWEKVEYPEDSRGLSKDVGAKLRLQIGECKKRSEDVDREIQKLGESVKDDVSKIQSFISLKKSLLGVKRYSCATEKTTLLSCWIPREEKDRALGEIRKVAGVSYIEERSPEELMIDKEEVPVHLKHTAFLKPFELLVDSYGIPRYGTIDPTVFVAISFLIMFGAMFGDVGQGLVLAIASFFIRRSKNEKVRQASALLWYCGISSAIFGVFYGSFFGMEYHALLFRPMENMLMLFKISVAFGIGVLTLGILFNVINALRDRDYVKALFDKAGLIVGVIYWAGIGLVTKAFIFRAPVPPAYAIVLIACCALLFFKPFVELFLHKKKESIFITFMESTIEVLEIAMVYLANTVSFVRIAAFALAHVGLFFAIFELVRVERGIGGGVLSFVTLVVGNVFVMLLEGLVVFIQSLRLNYYEFFSKFFVSGKHVYKPLSI